MTLKSKENNIGAWAFLIGVILAVIIGVASSTLITIKVIADYNQAIYAILVILGIIVGFMNVTGKDSQTFMLAGAILVIVSKFGMDGIGGELIGIGVNDILPSVFRALLVMFIPATIIVALKTVFSIAKV